MRSRDWISDLFFSDLSPTAQVAVSAPRAQSGPRDIYDTEPVVVLPVEDVRRELVAGVHTVGEPLEVDAPLRVERSLLFPEFACEALRLTCGATRTVRRRTEFHLGIGTDERRVTILRDLTDQLFCHLDDASPLAPPDECVRGAAHEDRRCAPRPEEHAPEPQESHASSVGAGRGDRKSVV